MANRWVRRLAKITGYVILGLLVLAAIALTFTVGWRPVIGAKKRALTSRKFESTPERLRRGEYLVHAVMHCMGCHSKYDEKAEPPVLLSKEGAGAVHFEEGSFRMVSPNITSDPETGLGKWSDDAIAGPFVKASLLTEGRCFLSCPTNTSATCPTKTWPPS